VIIYWSWYDILDILIAMPCTGLVILGYFNAKILGIPPLIY